MSAIRSVKYWVPVRAQVVHQASVIATVPESATSQAAVRATAAAELALYTHLATA
jgi:hypothetical protein